MGGSSARQSKMIGHRKPGRNAPYKWFRLPWGHDSLSKSAHVSIHMYSFPSNKHFTCSLHLYTISLWKFIFFKAERPGPLSLVTVPGGLEARVQYSQPDFNLWPRNQNPASSYCQLRPPEISTWKGSGCPTWRLSELLLLGVYGGFIIQTWLIYSLTIDDWFNTLPLSLPRNQGLDWNF